MSVKRNSKLIIMILGLGLIAASCKSADSDQNVSSGSIEAKIEGSSWKGSGGTAMKQTMNTGVGSVTTVTVAAAKLLDQSTGSAETMEVTIYGEVGADNIAERTYQVEADEIPKAQFSFTTYVDGSRVTYFASTGTVTISSVSDEKVEGTFEGTLIHSQDVEDSIIIEEGGFNVEFGYSFSF